MTTKEAQEFILKDNQVVEVPQLKDEFDCSDFEKYMIDTAKSGGTKFLIV